jgi:hypothetical protein
MGVGSFVVRDVVVKKIVALVFCLIFLAPCAALAGKVKTLKVTELSTLLADRGPGEWGYSALVEVDGRNGLTPLRTEYERLGGRFTLHEDAAELVTGVWFTGPVPRKYPETNWSTEGLKIHTVAGDVTDNVPEDAALVFSTPEDCSC